MDNKFTQYADAIYQHAVSESVQECARRKSIYLQQMAAQNPPADLPFSGASLQMIIGFYAQHIERCIEARLESYQKAYGDAKAAPTEEELKEVWKNVEDAQQHQIGQCGQSLQQFMNTRGLHGDQTKNLRAQSARAHDRALGKWKIWQGQVQLISKPAGVQLGERPGGVYRKWAAVLWPLGSTLLALIFVPVAIEQYPEFFSPKHLDSANLHDCGCGLLDCSRTFP